MTIYDIAAQAGVSASTVSRVINNKKGVNPETRHKVERLLAKYNFAPNASAKGLVSQSSKIIGIMMSDIRTFHHAEGAYFIEQQLRQVDYSCIIVNSGFADKSREDGFRLLASRRAEALVLIGSTFQTEQTEQNIQKYFRDLPIIIENGYLDLPNVYCVLADERNGIAECLRLLYRKGRVNPCYINMNQTPSNTLKMQGFSSVWQSHNPGRSDVPIVDIPRRDDEDNWRTCHRAVTELVKAHPEYDAMIFSTDLLANAGIRALTEAGVSVPDQVAVIGVDNSIYSRLCYPPMTVLDNKMQELSITCSNLLIQILNNETVTHRLMVLSDIIERGST